MQLHMLSTILSLAFPPALCVSSSFSKIYLYPPPSFPARFSGTALLSHHLGLEAYESGPLDTSTGETVLGGARPFVGQGPRDALLVSVDASYPDDLDVVPQSLHSSLFLSLTTESLSSLVDRYSRFAPMTHHSVVDTVRKSSQGHLSRFHDIFHLSSVSSISNSETVERFLTSLNNVVAFVEGSRVDDFTERFGVFEVVGLKGIEREWGIESEQYRTAVAALSATIQSAIANDIILAVIFPSHLGVRQLAQPPQSPLPMGVPATAPVFSTSTCFTSADTCRNATATCSSRGDCVSVTRAGRTCFVCECRKAPSEDGGKDIFWAGSMCQKKDISQEFTLIVGTVVFLILASVGSITLLYAIGNQELPGTLTGGIGGPSKRE